MRGGGRWERRGRQYRRGEEGTGKEKRGSERRGEGKREEGETIYRRKEVRGEGGRQYYM